MLKKFDVQIVEIYVAIKYICTYIYELDLSIRPLCLYLPTYIYIPYPIFYIFIQRIYESTYIYLKQKNCESGLI